MTVEEVYKILDITKAMDNVRNLIDNPAQLRFTKRMVDRHIFEIDKYYHINDDVTVKIKSILEKAQAEVTTILRDELFRLTCKFAEIEVKFNSTDESQSNNEK